MKKTPDFNKLYAVAENQASYFSSNQAEAAGYSYERLSDLTARG